MLSCHCLQPFLSVFLPCPHLRLQAALAGAQAARKEMERMQAASNITVGGVEAETRAVSARLAEAQVWMVGSLLCKCIFTLHSICFKMIP